MHKTVCGQADIAPSGSLIRLICLSSLYWEPCNEDFCLSSCTRRPLVHGHVICGVCNCLVLFKMGSMVFNCLQHSRETLVSEMKL